MNSWKKSFETICLNIDLAKRKKQALDELLVKKRMSHPTYEHLIKILASNISELKVQRRSIVENISHRMEEIKKQIEIFELLLAKLEIEHINEKPNEALFKKNKEKMILGIEATNIELEQISISLNKIGKKYF
jgi:hypothetical protein